MHQLYYRTAYNICTTQNKNYSELLYAKYCDTVTQYLQKHVAPSVLHLHELSLIASLKKHWELHKFMLKWLGKFFQYLDRFYVKMEKVLPLYDKGLEAFKINVFEPIKKALRRGILIEINKSREGELVDENMLKAVIEIFIEIGRKKKKPVVYDEDFEPEYLRDAEQYFQVKASQWLNSLSLSEYIFHATECIRSEEERISKYMYHKTNSKLKTIMFKEMVVTHSEEMLTKHNGFAYLLQEFSAQVK